MKRENRVKKIVAMMLALVLSVCQIPVISYAEDDAEQNGFISSEEINPEGMDDYGFIGGEEYSDEINPAESESPSLSAPETETAEATEAAETAEATETAEAPVAEVEVKAEATENKAE